MIHYILILTLFAYSFSLLQQIMLIIICILYGVPIVKEEKEKKKTTQHNTTQLPIYIDLLDKNCY